MGLKNSVSEQENWLNEAKQDTFNLDMGCLFYTRLVPYIFVYFFQVENIEDFKRLCEINCKGDEEIKDMVELRRKIKNRVSFPDSLSLFSF